jgi:hypothetical protein
MLRKLWFAAAGVAALAVVAVAVPVIAHQTNATTAAKSRAAGDETSVRPTRTPAKTPVTPRPTVPPKAPSTVVPTKTPKPSKTPPVGAAHEAAAGPAVAGSCHGVVIKPGQNAQSVVNAKPAGTTFCFAAGVHRISQTIRPKANTTLASATHAVLTGSVPLTGWTKSGSSLTAPT